MEWIYTSINLQFSSWEDYIWNITKEATISPKARPALSPLLFSWTASNLLTKLLISSCCMPVPFRSSRSSLGFWKDWINCLMSALSVKWLVRSVTVLLSIFNLSSTLGRLMSVPSSIPKIEKISPVLSLKKFVIESRSWQEFYKWK